MKAHHGTHGVITSYWNDAPVTSPSFGDGRRSTVNKSYEPHHGIKLKELTRLYQNEGVKKGDRGTSK